MQPAADLTGLRVGHLGHFDPGYARNLVMARALRAARAEVVEFADTRSILRRTPALLRRAAGQDLDLVLVGFPGYIDAALARVLTLPRRIPVISDIFVSLYETAEDRGAGRAPEPGRLAVPGRGLVVLPPGRQGPARHPGPHRLLRRALPAETGDVPPGVDRGRRGAPPTPAPRRGRGESAPFRVLFVGTFIPLHGFDHIVDAAEHLEREGRDVEFVVAGGGQRMADSAPGRDGKEAHVDPLPGRGSEKRAGRPHGRGRHLPRHLRTGGKAARVIPNKLFEALAMARPVITADTPAVREALVDGVHVRLCPPGDGGALAAAIASLQDDDDARQTMGDAGRQLFREKFSVAALSADVGRIVTEVLAEA